MRRRNARRSGLDLDALGGLGRKRGGAQQEGRRVIAEADPLSIPPTRLGGLGTLALGVLPHLAAVADGARAVGRLDRRGFHFAAPSALTGRPRWPGPLGGLDGFRRRLGQRGRDGRLALIAALGAATALATAPLGPPATRAVLSTVALQPTPVEIE